MSAEAVPETATQAQPDTETIEQPTKPDVADDGRKVSLASLDR